MEFSFSADRNQLFKAWRAIANLADLASKVNVTVQAELPDGVDKDKLEKWRAGTSARIGPHQIIWKQVTKQLAVARELWRPFLCKDFAQFLCFHVAACAHLLAEVPSKRSMKRLAECQRSVVGSVNPIK